MMEYLSDVGYVAIYVNGMAIMLAIGVMALASRLQMRDEYEKKIYMSLLALTIGMAVFYILMALRDDGVLPCSHMVAILIETIQELMINVLAVQWFIYVDYRLFHSPGHLKRKLVWITGPMSVSCVMLIVNMFTGFLFYFDENLVYHETIIYHIMDMIRLGYFIGSIFSSTAEKKQDDGNIRFFTVRPFFVSIFFFVFIYYVTPYPTVALGMAVGFSVIYVDVVNEYRYLDKKTGFYNRRYFYYMRDLIRDNEYELNSAMMFKISQEDILRTALIVDAQLPDGCDTIRYDEDTLLILAHVKDRSPLQMVSMDVEDSLEAAMVPVEITYDLKKKKETGYEFLERFLKNA